MRTVVFGLMLVLALVTTSPLVAAEEKPFQWPSFDLVEWVFGLLDIFELESFSMEIGPLAEPGGEENPPVSEIGPAAEPWG